MVSRMVRLCIQMFRIPFERLEFIYECFKSLSIVSNLDSNTSNPIEMIRVCIQTLQMPFEPLEFAFKCFEFGSNGHNLQSNPF